jgi:hypothetical protein
MFTRFFSIAFLALAVPSARAEIASLYTTLDIERDCSTVDAPGPGEAGGDWGVSLCNGWGGYPIYVDYGDARESLYFGFIKPVDGRLPFQSFSGFNSAGDKIEWRIETDKSRERAIATIVRWKVTVDPNTMQQNDVLVVSKVGQMDSLQACVVGYVLATGDAEANAKARVLADAKAKTFACGKDTPQRIGAVPEPMGDVFAVP